MRKYRLLTASIVANLGFALLAGCGGGGGSGGASEAVSAVNPASFVVDVSNAQANALGGSSDTVHETIDLGQVNGSAFLPPTTGSSAEAGGTSTGGTATGGTGTSPITVPSTPTTGGVVGKEANTTAPVVDGSGSSNGGSKGNNGSSIPSAGSNGAAGGAAAGGQAANNDNGNGAPTSVAAVLPVIAGGYLSTSAEAARLYGPGVYLMDGLWNIDAKRDGARDTVPGIRFRAPYSGPLSSIRLYWSDGTGYAGGNGGDIEIRLLPDDGSARHLPDWSATPLAVGRRQPGSMSMSAGKYSTGAHRFSPDVLSGSGQLEAGKFYHLVGINNTGDPAVNWSSWDMSYAVAANGHPARWHNPYDFAALYGWRAAGSNAAPSWQDWTVDGHAGAYVLPIVQMTMADGKVFGNSNMETGNVDAGGSSRVWKNGSVNPIRERFTPARTRTITGLSFNAAKASGSGGLGWQIVDGSTVLASGTFAQASANYRIDTSVGSAGVMTWYDAILSSPVKLDPGKTYDVVFTPQANSVWVFADQRNGGAYGFDRPAAFTESQAQHYSSGAWINANHWNKSTSASGSNWRVVLHGAS